MKKYHVVKRDHDSVAQGIGPIIATCGHNHRSRQAAEVCREKLTRSTCNHGVTTGKRCYHCSGWVAKNDSSPLLWRRAGIEEV